MLHALYECFQLSMKNNVTHSENKALILFISIYFTVFTHQQSSYHSTSNVQFLNNSMSLLVYSRPGLKKK